MDNNFQMNNNNNNTNETTTTPGTKGTKKVEKNNKNGKKGKIILCIIFLIIILIIAFLISNKNNGNKITLKNNITDLEKIAVKYYLNNLDVAELHYASETIEATYGDTLDNTSKERYKKALVATFEYNKNNTTSNEEQDEYLEKENKILDVYEDIFDNIESDDEKENTLKAIDNILMSNLGSYSSDSNNITENSETNTDNENTTDEMIVGNSLYKQITNISKESSDEIKATLVNVTKLNITKLQNYIFESNIQNNENKVSNIETESLKDNYSKFIDDSNIDNFKEESYEINLKLKVKNEKIYIEEF